MVTSLVMCRSHKNNTPRVLHRLWDPVFSTDLGTPCFHDRPRRPGTLHPGPALSSKPSVNASRSDIGTVPLFLACVASVSNRVIARKLEWEQKKKVEAGLGGEKRFLLSPPPPPSFLFFALDELARKRLLRRLLFFSRPPPPATPPELYFPTPAPLGTFENQDGRHRYITFSTTLSSAEASLGTVKIRGRLCQRKHRFISIHVLFIQSSSRQFKLTYFVKCRRTLLDLNS